MSRRLDPNFWTIVLAGLGAAIAAALLNGCTSMDVTTRYGLPKAYEKTFIVWAEDGDQVCVLYPDGHLDLRAGPELAVRVLIDQLKEARKAGRTVAQNAAREKQSLEAKIERQAKDLAELRKQKAETEAKD